jgi:hypothetical protein
MEVIMIKKWLTRAADRGFGLIAAMMLRRAIGRLVRIDESSLSEAGLSRAAVADFLTSPIGTDPHRFFSRRRARDNPEQIATDLPPGEVSATAAQCPADVLTAFDIYRARTGELRRAAILRVVRQMVGVRFRILTAGVLVAVGALTACSGGLPDRDASQTRRDQPARCRLRPDSFPLSPNTPSKERSAPVRSTVVHHQHAIQPEARAGPSRFSG